MKILSPQKWTDINKVQIPDGSSQNDENSKSTKVDGYKIKVHRLDGSSQEDENSKSTKVDGYKQSPETGRMMKILSLKMDGINHLVHEVDGSSIQDANSIKSGRFHLGK